MCVYCVCVCACVLHVCVCVLEEHMVILGKVEQTKSIYLRQFLGFE